MKRKLVVFSALALALSLSACGDTGDETTDNGVKPIPSELRGRWKSACVPADALQSKRTQREYIFNAIGDFDKYERFYSDEACSKLLLEYKLIGTVNAQGDAPAATDPGAQLINFNVNDASLKVVSESLLPYLNGTKTCGRSDWSLGEEVPVLNADCLGYTLSKGDVVADIYDLEDGQLYFGKGFLFLAAAGGRPEELNREVPYSKE